MTAIRLSDALSLPKQWDGLIAKLHELFARIGLTDLAMSLSSAQATPPSVDPGPLTEVEALALLGWYEGGVEVPAPDQAVSVPIESPPDLTGTDGTVVLQLEVLEELTLDLAGLDGVSVVLNPGGCEARLSATSEGFKLETRLVVALRVKPEFLRPVKMVVDGNGKVSYSEDKSRPYCQIDVGLVGITVDSDTGLEVEVETGVRLTSPVAVGDTGVVIEEADLAFNFGGNGARPAGTPASWRGVLINNASMRIPDAVPGAFFASGFGIGSGGVSGTIGVAFQLAYAGGIFSGEMVGEVFGIVGGVEEISLTLQQSVPAGGVIKVQALLPFFEATDKPVGLEIGWTASGGFVAAIRGLGTLARPGIMSFELAEVQLTIDGGLATLALSGKLTPLLGGDKGLKWPSFDVKELSIDSKGHVHLDGGWLSLPQQQTLDFYGFKIEISQLGFGNTDDGGKWIGFSGGLKLVDGLQAGASVEGLRITWYEDGREPKITLNGAGVELEIPDVLALKGEVSFHEIEDKQTGEMIRRFDGDIHLRLETLNLEIDGTLVIGSVKGPQGRYNFFAIYVDVELPTGIPLANTGLAIYGFAGLFALQMEPDKRPSEQWFAIDHSKSFYHRGEPGITDLKKKWAPRKDSFAVGAGLTLATLSDNGYTFNGKFLLAIVIPGPIVLIQGAASFLTQRADGDSEGQFRALTVIDGRAGSLTIGLDAEYKTGSGGELIEIGGSMEAFYAFHDPTAWHLWLGQREPRELRIRAFFGRFVEANAYFMLDARALALGAWFGYSNGWSFGPLSVRLEAWAEGNALLSFKPTHFRGDLWLHCLLELSAFGIGLGIAIDARIAADLFKPYHLLGTFSVGIKLPWPFHKKKLGGTVTLEWGPQRIAPPLPLPLVDVGIEHLKTSVTWPLPRRRLPEVSLIEPNWDDGAGFLAGPTNLPAPAATAVPRVPLDARIAVTFARSMHDAALVGNPVRQIEPEFEAIGNPAGGVVVNVKYVLRAVTLERWDGGWRTVARSPKAVDTPTLFGSWMPLPQLPTPAGSPVKPGQTKLLLWSKTPFDFVRHTGSSWEEWVSDAMPDYPCIPVRPTKETCFGFGALAPGTRIESPWTHPGPPAVTLSWGFGPATVSTRTVPAGRVNRTFHVLCFPQRALQSGVTVDSQVPGKRFRLVLAPDLAIAGPSPAIVGTIDDATVCVDFRARNVGTVCNPWSAADEGARFTVRDAGGGLAPVGKIERWGDGQPGLNAGYRLDVDLSCPSSWVELLVTHRPPFRIVAFDAAGTAVATYAPGGSGGEVTETIRLEGEAITHLTVYAAGSEKLVHRLCFLCDRTTGPSVTAFDAGGLPVGSFYPTDGVITVDGPEISVLVITGDGPLCLEQICVTPDPEAGQEVRQEEAIQHIDDALARWRADGAVLAPDTFYRLTVETGLELDPADPKIEHMSLLGLPANRSPFERAYFHTAHSPGLEVLQPPEGVPATNFDSGLDDLVRYVRETDPPTVPPAGEKPILFKPFYRAYDIGVEFNEDYVEQMYRLDGRDLGLYLFDSSNQPVRDARGRLLALAPRWDRADTLTLSERETRWLTLIGAAKCIPDKPNVKTFARDATLVSAEARVLAPDRLHEARLVPLLLHESFTAGVVGVAPPGWFAEDSGPGAPSAWKLGEVGAPPSRFVEQTSAIGSAAEPDRPGTVLLLADPAAGGWTDYRLNVYVGSAAGGAVGVVFRYRDAGGWCRFSLGERGRRLVKAGPAGLVVLAEDHVSYRRNRDYLLTVEAVGKSLRAYVDGQPVFAVEDAELAAGRIGLYASQSPGARFTDLRVDDFRPAAPVVYRFQLTTSRYANFFHHLHGFEDRTWTGSVGAEADEPLKHAVPFSFAPPSETENRAYEAVADAALQAAALQNAERVEVTRLARAGGAPLLLLRAPEPLGWGRVELELSRPTLPLPPPQSPGEVKLTDVAFGAARPAEESVSLLLREGLELGRHRIEARQLPGAVGELEDDPILVLESFRDASALGRFEIVDPPGGGPSQWQVEGGALIQLAAIANGSEPALPGTHALTGEADWTDYRLTVDLRSDSGGSLGVVFRWRDADNHYRLAVDATLRYRRLVKVEAGVVSILWEDDQRYAVGEPFRLVVEAVGARLTGWLDGARLFEVVDGAHANGRVGIYAWNDPTVRCERLEVRRPSLAARARLRDRFAEGDLAGWTLASEVPGVPLTSSAAWQVAAGALRLTSLLGQGGDPAYPGAYAFAGDLGWTDAILRVRLRSQGGAMGAVFRANDLASYYRFAMSGNGKQRQLVKKVGGTTTVLWQDGVAYEVDRTYELTIVAAGSSLRGWLDGVPLFAVEDGDLASGRVGVYAWNNPEAWFSGVRVWPAELAFSDWGLDEPFDALLADRWSFADEAGAPATEAWKVEGGALRCEPAAKTWEGFGGGWNGTVLTVALAGSEVFAGGDFTVAGGVAARGIARWDGKTWSPLGTGVDGSVGAIVVDGDRVYAGGQFTKAGAAAAANVAVWDRTKQTWSALGAGVTGWVRALAADGARVYAGGSFAKAGEVAAANVAAWNKSAAKWEPLGGGVNGRALALAHHAGFLYVGGDFSQAGGQPARRVARWDGTGWVAASTNVNGAVTAIAAGQEGIFIGGQFTQASGAAASRIARWNGTAWSALGAGVDAAVEAIVLDGNQVWVAGRFTQAGGAPASRLARWDRAAGQWSAAGGGVDGDAFALAYDGDRLFAGGAFATAGGVAAPRIAGLPLGGTHVALVNEPAADELRLTTRLTPAASGAVGVLLRWQDAANHLAFWLDPEHGSRRLVRLAAGKVATLWQDAVRPEPGRQHAVTLDVFGGRLVGFVDGVQLFALDAGAAGGRIGLALRRSPAARVHELRWAAPRWSCWHAFGDEEWLAAGTRVQVHGALPAAAAPQAGVVQRSAALDGESGELRLRPQGVELRLLQPDGTTGHARAFLPATAYAPVSFAVLRKADGTGLFLIPAGSEGAGPLRLKLTYHRNRPEAGRPFSQAGDRSAERVTLDIP